MSIDALQSNIFCDLHQSEYDYRLKKAQFWIDEAEKAIQECKGCMKIAKIHLDEAEMVKEVVYV